MPLPGVLPALLALAFVALAAADSSVAPVRVGAAERIVDFIAPARDGYCGAFAFDVPAGAALRIRLSWTPPFAGAVTFADADAVPVGATPAKVTCYAPPSVPQGGGIQTPELPEEPVNGSSTSSFDVRMLVACYDRPATVFISYATRWAGPDPSLFNATEPRTLSFNLTTDAPRDPCLPVVNGTASTTRTASATATATTPRPGAAGGLRRCAWTVGIGAAAAGAALAW